MKAVIMAGGYGTRLRPITYAVPKPLLHLGSGTLIERQIAALRHSGFNTIFISIHYKANYVRKFLGGGADYGVDLHYVEETTPLGTCGALSLMASELDEPFLVMNCDVVTDLDLHKFFLETTESNALLTVATAHISQTCRYGVIATDGLGYITGFSEKPSTSHEILAGVYHMRPAVFRYIPRGQPFGIDDLIRALLGAREPLRCYRIPGNWIDVGEPADFERARQMIESALNPPHAAASPLPNA